MYFKAKDSEARTNRVKEFYTIAKPLFLLNVAKCYTTLMLH